MNDCQICKDIKHDIDYFADKYKMLMETNMINEAKKYQTFREIIKNDLIYHIKVIHMRKPKKN